MINLSLLFKKTLLTGLVAVLALAALPVTSAYASGLNDRDDPPANAPQVTDERLELVWARMQLIYERQGRILERADEMMERAQNMINRMNENEKNTTSLQAARDAFADALKKAHPVYESAKGIINSHQGFNTEGKVTDREKALETVKSLGDKLQEVRQITGEPGKALREAIKAFRDARRPSSASVLNLVLPFLTG